MDNSNDTKHEEKPETKSGLSKMKTIILFLTPPLIYYLYLIGKAFDQGFLSAYNVSPDYFPRSTYDYFVSAYIATRDAYIDLLASIIGPFFYLLLATIFIFIWISFGEWRKTKKEVKKKSNTKKDSSTFKFHLMTGLTAWCIFFVMSLSIVFGITTIYIVPKDFYNDGVTFAEGEKKNFASCLKTGKPVDKDRKCVTTCVYKDNAVYVSGQHISRSQSVLALYDGKKTIVIPSQGKVIQIFENETVCPTSFRDIIDN